MLTLIMRSLAYGCESIFVILKGQTLKPPQLVSYDSFRLPECVRLRSYMQKQALPNRLLDRVARPHDTRLRTFTARLVFKEKEFLRNYQVAGYLLPEQPEPYDS